MLDFPKLSATYQQALLRQVVPFWLKNSRDELCGGYFDLLSTLGEVIEGDKFVSLQAQQVWAFSWLYTNLDGQTAWLEHARHGAAFLSQFAHQDTLDCYARLDRRGRPVHQPADLIPDCFATMAYAQLHRATGEDEWAMLAKQTLTNLLERRADTRAEQARHVGNFQHLQQLSETAALLKLVLDMQPLLDEERGKEAIDLIIHEIQHEFLDRRSETLLDSVLPEGAFVNTPEGRRLNVGLTFQTAGYLLDFYAESASVRNTPGVNTNRKLAIQVTGWCLRLCEQAWDETNAGLNQYIDFKQQASIFPDWQQKWGWVQLEALMALLKSYVQTRQPDCLKWFKRIHDYTFQHFPDPKQTGWHLVLDTYAHPLLAAKAIPSVGCYSLIRCLAETSQLLTKCEPLQKTQRTGRAGISLNS
ncbi:AGE family epimerase/isomerase [Spirosoma linguale]|uniref:N-acyl-D-glucosamine 2-epimerase-like protein n=1 Tax=Spirosoma linguale (strain ATCC 33905 / DSM 74 / LMG 10896 / Claus 1) TaxID=504472 RepID=D2QSU7_SPILD|nr:N-acyl-D-glucosamine 2-epimerase-like protein [Spirosoma linguale DSM 74]